LITRITRLSDPTSARTAVGVAELPLGVPVEVDLVVLLR
jgi:enamine deaminase RidA (YjgF/YER057c/UK114 family)